jgi:indole-3-glycerol phosphate synthase
MSYALLLNDRLTEAQLMELLRLEHKLNMEFLEQVKRGMDQLETPEQKLRYYNLVLPLIVQMCFT